MNVEKFKDALALAQSSMPRSTPLPVLHTVRLKGDVNGLSILGSNLVSQVEADAGCGLGDINRCVDPNKLMHALAGRDEADIKVTDSALMVKAGGGRFKIPLSHEGNDYPTINDAGEDYQHIEVDGLVDAIQRSFFATASGDVSRPFLDDVCVRTINGRLMVYGVNSIFGSRTDMGESEQAFFCVPKEAALSAFNKAAILLGKNHMRLEFADSKMLCKVSSKYADLDAFFDDGDKALTCSAKEMIEAVSRVTKFGSQLMVGSRNLNVVKISVTDDGILVASPANDAEEIVAGSGDKGNHAFNASVLLQLLGRSGDSMDMCWKDRARVFRNGNWRGACACVNI